MPEHKSLTLRWHLFERDSSDVDVSIFGLEGGQYFDYVLQQPCVLFDYQTHKAKNPWRIIDTHFQDACTSVLLSVLPTTTANTIALDRCDYAAVCSARM